jgi:ketosteroid isomerase-like protein
MKRVFAGWKARDMDALLELVDPAIVARLALPPGSAATTYTGRDEISAFLHDGDAAYEQFDAHAGSFAVGPTGRVFAEGSVRYKRPGAGGIASVAYWVCQVRDDKIVFWEFFSDWSRSLAAAGLEPSA